MKRTILGTTFIVGLAAGAAHADSFSDAVVKTFLDQGFTSIEVKNGPTQTKVEAVKGSQEIEVVYSRADGSIIKQEVEAADGDDTPGIKVVSSDKDFVGGKDEDDDDDTDTDTDDDDTDTDDDDDDDDDGDTDGDGDDDDDDDDSDDDDSDGDDGDDGDDDSDGDERDA